ncbi:unnamed protein product, partial [Pylaiella littoralis]
MRLRHSRCTGSCTSSSSTSSTAPATQLSPGLFSCAARGCPSRCRRCSDWAESRAGRCARAFSAHEDWRYASGSSTP